VRIGSIQFTPVLGDLTATINKLSPLLAKTTDIDLLVLPELCNSGYNFVSKEQAWYTSEEIDSSAFINLLTAHCTKHQSYIVSGFNERDGKELYNSAVLVGPNGYIGKYQKLHLFHNEKDFFQPGKAGLPVFELPNCKIGLQVCFDWMYPEAWRILALKGAEIICHPSNLVLPGLAQKAVPIHALINKIFTITANRIGKEGDLLFTGLSTIATPKGEVIAQASADQEEILNVNINLDLARDKYITPKNHIFQDRRPDQYAYLTAPVKGTQNEE
jgi:predicted amidohydrolase